MFSELLNCFYDNIYAILLYPAKRSLTRQSRPSQAKFCEWLLWQCRASRSYKNWFRHSFTAQRVGCYTYVAGRPHRTLGDSQIRVRIQATVYGAVLYRKAPLLCRSTCRESSAACKREHANFKVLNLDCLTLSVER